MFSLEPTMYVLSSPRKRSLLCFLRFAHLLFLVFFSVEARLHFRCTFELELLSKALYIQSSICPWVHLLFVIHHSSVVKRAFSRLEGLSSISASDTRRTQWRICSSFVHLISLDLFVVHIDVVYTVVCFVLSLIISFLFLFNQWLFTCLQ